ncbi:MAG: aldo/keto reductase [Terrimicrobiaceae bacterium]|nr:aldo/keto reductase [Terrimicrobiaceae bacterium]
MNRDTLETNAGLAMTNGTHPGEFSNPSRLVFGCMSLDLLRQFVRQPLAVNQMELHLLNTALLDAGLVADQGQPAAAATPDRTLEYCRLHHIQLEAWSPLSAGQLGADAPQTASERTNRTSRAVDALAKKLGVANETIAIAWLLRHPARIQPVIGTRDPGRLRPCAAALDVSLTREQWYRLYSASRGRILH